MNYIYTQVTEKDAAFLVHQYQCDAIRWDDGENPQALADAKASLAHWTKVLSEIRMPPR